MSRSRRVQRTLRSGTRTSSLRRRYKRVGHRPECVRHTTECVGHAPGCVGHTCESRGHAIEWNFKITPRAEDYSQWYADVFSAVDVLMCVLDTPRASWIHPQRRGHTSDSYRHTRGRHVHTPESYGHLCSDVNTIGESLTPPERHGHTFESHPHTPSVCACCKGQSSHVCSCAGRPEPGEGVHMPIHVSVSLFLSDPQN